MINVVIISTSDRPALLYQTIESMEANAVDKTFTVTLVLDGTVGLVRHFGTPSSRYMSMILNSPRQGASASRNIGASSIPKYRRQEYVMFCDDDCFFCPKLSQWDNGGWDYYMLRLAESFPNKIISGHAHPFNHSELKSCNSGALPYREPLVISSVNMMMPWSLWDDVGFFTEPGGAGGSEDYDYCMRAKAKGYGFAVTSPECVLHTGITSSNGKPIVGQKEVIENNRRLMDIHGLKDVRFE